MRFPRLTAITLLVPFLSLPAVAGEASGEFTAGTRKPIRPNVATAFETRDPRDARRKIVEVVLSDAPVDAAAALAELDPSTHVINQPALRGHDYVLLWVRPGSDVSMNATYSEKMVQFMDMTAAPGSLKAEFTANTAERVAGRVSTPKPQKTMDGEMYSANLTFSATVVRPPAATKLPADGGDAGKAFNSLLAAISKKSWEGISQNVVERDLKMFTEPDRAQKENLAEALQLLGNWLPRKAAKVTGGESRGDGAVLEVEGEMFPGQKTLYLVKMVRSGSKWLFDRATSAGMIGD